MVDYNEFADSIKKKYPEYADRDNKQLAEAMVKKYPEYADRVTFDEVEPQQVTTDTGEQSYALQAQVNVPKDIVGGFISGLTEIPRAIQKLTAPVIYPISSGISYPIAQGANIIQNKPLQSFSNYSSEMSQLQDQLNQPYQPQSTAGEVAQFAGSIIPTLAMPQVKALKGGGYLANLGNQLLTGASQGAVLGGTQALNQDKNLGQGIAKGAGIGSLIGGTLGAVTPIAKGAVKAIRNLPKGIRETAGISQTSYERLKYSPRGADISAKSEEIGSPDFINTVANNLKNGVDTFKKQEITAFAKARDALLAQNKDASIDTTDVVNNAINKLQSKGFISSSPEGGIKLTRIGQKADKANELLSDILSYQGKIGIDDAQQLKTYILDDIINYKPQVGQQLNQATRDLQTVVRELRKGVNEKLNTTLGSEYTAINKKLSNVLDIVDNSEIKDITNAQNIDTIASKLKRTGTTRTETAKKLTDLEKLMNDNGIKLSDYSIIDDILDHQAANEINKRIQSGQGGGLGNIIRRSAVQPALEELILPAQGALSKLNLPKANLDFLGKPNIYNATLNR